MLNHENKRGTRPWRILFFEKDELVLMAVIYIIGMSVSYWCFLLFIFIIPLYKKCKKKWRVRNSTGENAA